MPAAPVIRVVVIDDSAYNRQTISAMLESDPGIQVVGRAADGDEGLKLVLQLSPDLVTLDLEMPRVDGFAFLRILMARRPLPVLVVSGWGDNDHVIKALELGALDFVLKPSRRISPELRTIQDELLRKVHLVTQLRQLPSQVAGRVPVPASGSYSVMEMRAEPPQGPAGLPAGLVAIGASTGGPPALQQILAALDPRLPLAVAVTQHMPPKFTRAFADRLQRTCRLFVKEAEDGDYLGPGQVLVAPGSGSLGIRREGAALRVAIEPRAPGSRYTPSVDRMLESAASAYGPDLLAVVLTGMGDDGARGVVAVKARGGRVIAESAETAVIFGMPQEAIASGAVDEVLPLGKVAEAIALFRAPPSRPPLLPGRPR